MNVEINEQEMQEYADERMKKRINDIVERRLKEIDWYKRVGQTVFDVVDRNITLERCNAILAELDRSKLVEGIAKYLATAIENRLFDGY